MAQTNLSIRIDEDLKKSMEITCQELGINLTTAFIIFAKKVSREKRIPFEVSIDPFYSESNINRLERAIDDVKTGKAQLTEHELIEAEEKDD
jgi:DNA-damage-inducible protein J